MKALCHIWWGGTWFQVPFEVSSMILEKFPQKDRGNCSRVTGVNRVKTLSLWAPPLVWWNSRLVLSNSYLILTWGQLIGTRTLVQNKDELECSYWILEIHDAFRTLKTDFFLPISDIFQKPRTQQIVLVKLGIRTSQLVEPFHLSRTEWKHVWSQFFGLTQVLKNTSIEWIDPLDDTSWSTEMTSAEKAYWTTTQCKTPFHSCIRNARKDQGLESSHRFLNWKKSWEERNCKPVAILWASISLLNLLIY